MAQREKDPRLQALYDQGIHVYSFSKLGVINDCLYQAYLTYVKHDKGLDSIYSSLGSVVHDSLQEVIEGRAEPDSLLPKFRAGLAEAESLGLSFPKDMRGNNSIRDKYVANLEHFCKNFVPPKGNFTAEELLILKVSDKRAIQGYSDLIQHCADGSLRVLDWKTSSRYKPSDLLEHGRQLVIYTMALEQMGYKTKDPGWIMAKYLEVKYMAMKNKRAKTETEMVRVCDRCKLFDTIGLAVSKKLEEFGYTDEDIEIYLHEFQKTNTLDGMPQCIKDSFSVKQYVQYFEVTDELRQECLDYINAIADRFESLDPGDVFQWEARKIDGSNSFFCNNLCGYRKNCEAICTYNRMIAAPKAEVDEDLF